MPIYSVCIPHYGSEKYLLEAVMSVANQTFEDFELVISQDSAISESLINEIIQLFENIKLVANPNKGIANNWNNCLSNASGEYIVLLHNDDYLDKDYLRNVFDLIQERPDGAAWAPSVKLIDKDAHPTNTLADSIKSRLTPSDPVYELSGDKGLSHLLSGCFIYCPAICYKSEVIKSYRFSNEWQMVLDLELYSRLLIDGYKIIGTRDRLYNYRRHEENQTTKLTVGLTRFTEEWALYDQIAKQALSVSWSRTSKVAKKKVMLRLHLLYVLLKSSLFFRFKSIPKGLKLLIK
jgi:glycosyltransferase involved in cell wall biosynthesis